MTHENFEDEQLEKLLNTAPKLSDHRSKEDVLKRLLADARLQDNSHLQAAINDSKENVEQPKMQHQHAISMKDKKPAIVVTKRKRSKLPFFMGIASVFALTILVSSMFLNGNSLENKADSNLENATTIQADNGEAIESPDAVMDRGIEAARSKVASQRTSVYDEDVTDATVFRIGLASSTKESVPMTYVIPNERVAADFGDEKPTTLQLYEKYAPQIDEEAMGFSDYHPYKGELKEQGEQLVHEVPEENEYDTTPATVNMYTDSLKDTFSDYKEVAVKTAERKVSEHSQADELSEPIKMTGKVNHYNYYLFREKNGVEYLTPNAHQTYDTVMEALQAMHHKNDDNYIPVVPGNVTYAVTEVEDGVIVTFDAPLDLQLLNQTHATQLIEAMMLTTASFDKKLRLENVVQDSWEGFDLKNYLPIPVGANKQYMP